MDSIIILDVESSGVNYIKDAIARRLKPVCFNFKEATSTNLANIQIAKLREKFLKNVEVHDIGDDYEEILSLAKKTNPKAIVSCNDHCYELLTKLCNDLDLPCNSLDTVKTSTNKFYMHNALKKNGLRYIKGEKVSSVDEAISFYENNNINSFVVKHPAGTSSLGLHMGESLNELEKYVERELNEVDAFGKQIQDVLIQEKIAGQEYVVNTISRDGEHFVTSLWKYIKKRTKSGGYVYDYCENIIKSEPGFFRLINYAFSCLDALGIKNGPVHGEYMIDDKGPVLIEVNCRVMGAGIPRKMLNRAHGHHETDIILDCLLDKENFNKYKNIPYSVFSKALIKTFIAPQNATYYSLPIVELSKNLSSMSAVRFNTDKSNKIFSTVDFETSPGSLFLCSDNELKLKKDLQYVRYLETENFDMLFEINSVDETKKPKILPAIEDIISNSHLLGSVVILTNDNINRDLYVSFTSHGIVHDSDEYDNGVFDIVYKKEMPLSEIFKNFFLLINHIKTGGKLIVPKSSFWFLPKQVDCLESLCEFAQMKVLYDIEDGFDTFYAMKI